jgi:2-amino-4-hydroxy-6-hydroxymethyldihydropteridine diphosphokinase
MSERPANRAYLSLGSNIEPEKYLPAAVRELAPLGRIAATSSVWESAPFGASAVSDQSANTEKALADKPPVPPRTAPNFLNAAVLLETDLSPAELYQAVATIEERLGRVRDPHDKNAPRTIDIDLSLFNRDVFECRGHRVPDPDLMKRAFVAVPLAELDPAYVHPLVERRLADVAAELRARSDLIERPDVNLR